MGFISGPNMLNIVLIPSSFLMGATMLMEGWKCCAKRNENPEVSRLLATSSSERFKGAPRASMRSALPHLESYFMVNLENLPEEDLLPCLAQGTPHAAMIKEAAVEALKVSQESPPVPTMSNSTDPSDFL